LGERQGKDQAIKDYVAKRHSKNFLPIVAAAQAGAMRRTIPWMNLFHSMATLPLSDEREIRIMLRLFF